LYKIEMFGTKLIEKIKQVFFVGLS
jgi:hypothetical protein